MTDAPLAPGPIATVDFAVRRVAWAPDAQNVAVAGDGASSAVVGLIDTMSGALDWQVDWQVADLGPRAVQAMAFAPDGATLAVGGQGRDTGPGGVRLLDRKSGRTLWDLPGLRWIQDLVFSPDGQLLAVSEAGMVHVVEVSSGTERFASARYDGSVLFTPAFSADSRSIAVAARGGCALLDTATGQPRWTSGGGALVMRLAFTADATRLVFCQWENHIHVLATDTGAIRSSSPLQGPAPSVVLNLNSIFDVSRDGDWVLKATRGFTPNDAKVGVWSTSDGSARFPMRQLAPSTAPTGPESVSSLYISKALQLARFSADGRRLAVASGETAAGFMVLDAQTGDKLLEDLSEPASGVAFDPSGHGLAVAGEHSVRTLWEDKPWHELAMDGPIRALAPPADRAPRVAACTDREASVFDTGSGERLLRRQSATAVLTAPALSADGQTLALADAGGSVEQYTVATGQRGWRSERPGAPVLDLASLPGSQGDLVSATGNPLPIVRRLAGADGAQRWASKRHPRAITQLAVDPAGSWVATGCADGQIRVMSADNGLTLPFTIQRSGSIKAVLFTFHGTTMPEEKGVPPQPAAALLIADTTGIVLADPMTGEITSVLGLPDFIAAVDISGDGSLLAAASDKRLQLFDAADTITYRAEVSFTSEIIHVRFDPPMRRLCVATDDAAVWLLAVPALTPSAVHHHPDRITAVAFNHEGKVVTACADQALRIF